MNQQPDEEIHMERSWTKELLLSSWNLGPGLVVPGNFLVSLPGSWQKKRGQKAVIVGFYGGFTT